MNDPKGDRISSRAVVEQFVTAELTDGLRSRVRTLESPLPAEITGSERVAWTTVVDPVPPSQDR